MRFLLIIAVFVVSAVPTVLAERDGDWTYSVSNNQATITGYTGAGGALTVPSLINGIPVVQVGNGTAPLTGWSPIGSQSIASISISQGISRIGGFAFYGSSIASFDIPSSVTSIGEYAFYYCFNLTTLRIPDSVFNIADGALCGLKEITNFTLESPNSNFAYLNGVLFNKNQTSLIVAFPKCLSGATYAIPNTVTSIGVLAFLGCGNLVSMTIPSSVTAIRNGAFADCVNLTNIILPNSLAEIGMYVFNGCASLESINIPPNLTSIGQEAFGNCSVSLVSSVISQLAVNQINNLTAGRNDVINSPNSYSLYTANQIHNLGLGGIVLSRDTNNQLTLNYQVLQSSDLQNWTPYQNVSLPITNAPSDKMFLRVQAVGQ
jgi:hypothetical protein